MLSCLNCSLSYQYGNELRSALQDVTFSVAAGEIFGIIGANGAGKSSLFKLAAGLLQPDSGQVMVCGKDPRFPETRKSIGYMPEKSGFFSHHTVEEELRLYAEIHGWSEPDLSRHTKYLLRESRLLSAKDKLVTQLSKGMAQRLALARAMLHSPSLLLLDEAGDGLDPQGQLWLREIIKNYAQAGNTVIITSHILSEIEQLCNRVCLLSQGKVIGLPSLPLSGQSLAEYYFSLVEAY